MKSICNMGNAVGSFFSKGYQKVKGAFIQNKDYGEEKYLQKDEDIDLNQCDGEAPPPSQCDVAVQDFEHFYTGYIIGNKEEIEEIVKKWKKIMTTENIRLQNAHPKVYNILPYISFQGGMQCLDLQSLRRKRGIGKELIIEFGKRILSGQFNLTKIPFPIKCMVPQSVLEKSVHGSCLLPFYMGLASLTEDPVERFKYVISSMIGTFIWTNNFNKPLNPILGETLEAKYNDGSEVYSEQISHHPPISYILVIGPNKFYQYSGYYNYEVKAGINSITILNTGRRCIKFNNGQTIYFNFTNEYYSGTLFGTCRQESYGIMQFMDFENNIKTDIQFGKNKKLQSDYFEGELMVKGKKNCKIQGTYLGFINFDNERYWDYQEVKPYLIQMNQEETTLPSDHLKRQDLKFLKQYKLAEAQKAKNQLEEIQRQDRSVRAKGEKERQKEKKQIK